MSSSEGNHKSTGAIRTRAQQLGAGGVQDTAEAELLAAIADGTLSFKQIDDDSLARCVGAFGPDSVVQAFVQAANVSQVSDEPAKIAVMPASVSARSRKHSVGIWRTSALSWVAAVLVIVVVGAVVFFATRTKKTGPPEQTAAENHLSLQWPAQPPFDPSHLKPWSAPTVFLPKQLPNFNQGPSTLGASGVNRFAPWQLATVIVRSEHGWGSGAFISRDGWLLSSYHVVAGTAQEAAVTGTPAKLDVITARIVNGVPKPQPALKATLYRADPVRDLALLKLDSLPGGRSNVAFFRLAANVRNGEDCFFVGPHKNGPPWSIRSGNVSRQFDYMNVIVADVRPVAGRFWWSAVERNRRVDGTCIFNSRQHQGRFCRLVRLPSAGARFCATPAGRAGRSAFRSVDRGPARCNDIAAGTGRRRS